MPFIEVNGLSVYYEIHGDPSSDAKVLNISGTGNDLRTSFPNLSPLNASFQVLHYDQRGLGQTRALDASAQGGPWEMTDYADDAAALMGALGWDHAHVVGTSFGGMVALHLAIRNPELVDRLVLNCTSPGGSKASFPLHTIESLDVEARLELTLGLFDNRWDPGQPEPIPGLGPVYDIIIERARTPRTGDALVGYLGQLDARSRHDVERTFHKIKSQTLVCGGYFDDQAPPANSEALAAGIANAELAMFDGGHLFLLQDRSAFATIIGFLTDGLLPGVDGSTIVS